MRTSYLLLEGYNLSLEDLYFYNFLSKVGNVEIEMIIKFNPFDTRGRRRTHLFFVFLVVSEPTLFNKTIVEIILLLR